MSEKLSKKELERSAMIWFRKKLTVFGMERLQASGLQLTLVPLLEKYYKDDTEGRIRVLTRHRVFFNTEPATGACIPGIVVALEEDIAQGSEISDDFIQNIKVGLMGPFAGIGDALNQTTIPPIMKSICIGLSAGGSILGAVVYVLWNLAYPFLWTRFWFFQGYNLGTKAADSILGDNMARIQSAMSVCGLTVTGAICASYVNVKLLVTYTSAYATVSVQGILDNLFPKLLSVLLVLFGWWMMTKKGTSPIKLMGMYALAVVVLCLLGIL